MIDPSTDPSPLRIAHVHPVAFDIFGHKDEDWGGPVKYFVSNIAAVQAGQGDRPTVHLLTSFARRSAAVDGIEVRFHRCIQPPRTLPHTQRFGRQVSLSLLRAIRREDADVVHFHGACHLHAMFGLVALAARRQGLPLIGHDQGPRDGRWLERRLLRIGLARSDAVLASSAERRRFLLAEGVADGKIQIAPNGYDHRVFHPSDRRARRTGDPFSILVVSRLWEDKDPMTMAEAVCGFARRGHATRLAIIGQGVMRAQVEQRLRAAPIDVEFIEHMPQEKLAELYRTADAFLLTSLREGWNCAVIEAMASGVPVVATDIDGVRDAVGDAALLVPVRRPDLAADALERLTTPEIATYFRARGIARSRDYTWERAAARLRAIYLSCIALKRGEASVPGGKRPYAEARQ